MSQKAKKPRLDRSDDSDYSEQEITIHASYEDEFTISSPREGRGDTGIKLHSYSKLHYAQEFIECN